MVTIVELPDFLFCEDHAVLLHMIDNFQTKCIKRLPKWHFCFNFPDLM
jgi:hypothetical protein